MANNCLIVSMRACADYMCRAGAVFMSDRAERADRSPFLQINRPRAEQSCSSIPLYQLEKSRVLVTPRHVANS